MGRAERALSLLAFDALFLLYFNVFILNGECSVLHDGRRDMSRPYYLTNLKNKKVALIKRRQGSRKRGIRRGLFERSEFRSPELRRQP